MAKSKTSVENYQLKITLLGSKPPIWRRFIVPGNIKLDRLHDVIQCVMGWYDCHLHGFDIGEERYTALSRDGVDLEMEGADESKFRLSDVVGLKTKFRYEYDFGDGWEHQLLVEKILDAKESKPFSCLAGKGACPPEDCGGIWGYYHLLKVLSDPKHPEHDSMKEWMDREIDPDEFDITEMKERLAFF